MSEEIWIDGAIPILAVLESGSREISTILVNKNRWGAQYRRLMILAQSRGIQVQKVDSAAIDVCTDGTTHGGAAALVGPRKLTTLESLIADRDAPFAVMLEGIEDPYNFGHSVRALYAAGVDGVVLHKRNWLSAAAVVARSSAGASELMPMATVESANDAAAFYRKRGLTIACTTSEDATSIFACELSQPLFLVIGGEKRGISRSLMAEADLRLRIPYHRSFRHALGTVGATAVLAFEIMRQRGAWPKSRKKSDVRG